jgi:hypothetical protein
VLALVDPVLELDLQALGLVFGRDVAADALAHAELIDPRPGRHQPFLTAFPDAHLELGFRACADGWQQTRQQAR